MRRIGSLIAMMLLAIWMPATLHCELEFAGLIPESDCCHDGDKQTGRDNDADACIDVESNSYRIDSPVLNLAPVDLPLVLLEWVPTRAVAETGHWNATAAPPGLRQQWQFVRRAALPPRAP